MSEQTAFESLQDALKSGGQKAVLERLIDELRQQKQPHELFAALKMRSRMECGLPLVQEEEEELDNAIRDRLEDGLFTACREAGLALLGQGKIREGWMYLRPVGDRAAAVEALQQIDANEENIEELIEVCLHEAVDPARGFSLVLKHYGTCNSITTMDSVVAQQPVENQRIAAGLLLEHLHAELLDSVTSDVAQQQDAQPTEKTLESMVSDRDWLFGEHSYHVDTTHLASTVRFSEMLTEEKDLRLAIDLTEYGRRLHSQFQYQGDEPFGDIYVNHALYFRAQVGEQVDEALALFAEKAKLDPMEHGTTPIEIYVDLLHRIGRHAEAIEALKALMPQDIPARGIAPSLLTLCRDAGDYQPLLEHCREANDLVGYATGLMCKDN